MKREYPIIVAGAGGGKGGGAPRAASEAPNSLRSKQIAHIIDLLGEGEWEGLVDGPGGIYLNNVALFTPTSPTGDVIDFSLAASDDSTWSVDGTWNFKGITLEFRNGTQSQAAIKSASSNSSVQSVNLGVIHYTPITTSITNPNVDTAIVNVQVDALYQQDPTNGDISGYYVDIEIQVRHASGSWVSIKQDRIEGKCMSPYVRAYSIDLTAISVTPNWDVKVIRTSVDDIDSSKHSTVTFVGVDIMSRDKFRYPNSVLCSIGVDAHQLNSIPSRAYDVKMTRVRVPSNYNPTTRAYTGVWDGTFQIAWTDNPAWCLYDLVTHERYGLGEYIDDTLIDKWALYTIGQYCDELVDDGYGGTEPRFTLNCYLQTAAEAINVIQNLSSVFRGILYYLNEAMTAIQDAPSDPVYQFTKSNVVDGQFSYSGSSGSTRHSVVMVVWNNPEIDYKQDIEVVEDVAGLLRFGYRPVTVQAMGCTSRGQAHRLGRWTLYVEQYEADIISFSTSLEGTGVQPGNIVEVYDPVRANISLGGRVLGVAGQIVHIDRTVTLPSGTHTLTFVSDAGALVTRNFTITSGDYDHITLDSTGAVPSVASIFGIQTSAVLAQQFRIISITESDRHKYDITGVSHNPGKYDYVENDLALAERPIRFTNEPLSAVAGFTFTESLYLLADGSIANRLIVSWTQNQRAVKYAVSVKVGSGNWSAEQTIESHQLTINSAVTGWVYSFRISSIALNDVRGGQGETSYTVLGTEAPPPPFDILTCTVDAAGLRRVTYGYSDPTDQPLDYLGAQVRWSSGSSVWASMTPLGEGFFTNKTIETNQIPSGAVYISARAEDMTHNVSTILTIHPTLGGTLDDAIDAGPTPDLTAPPTPTGFALTAGLSHIFVTHNTPSYTTGHGHAKTRLYGKIYSGGALPTFASSSLLAEFTGTVYAHPAALGTTWRMWIKWVSEDGVESSSPAGGTNGLAATTGVIGTADLTDALITAAKLAAGAVTLSKFSSSITPVEIVTTLPTTGNYEGRTVYLTTDDKIYRHTGSPTGSAGFSKATDGADILAGSVVANSIAAGAITAVKMAVNSIAVGTAAIENGAITNVMLGTAIIDNAKIASLAVDSAKIANLTVGTTKITDGAVTQSAAAFTAGSISVSSSTVQTVVLTTTGAPVLINFGCVLSHTNVTNTDFTAVLKRDGTTLMTVTATVFSYGDGITASTAMLSMPPFKETPTAASHTYTVVISASGGGSATNRGMSVLEVKK